MDHVGAKWYKCDFHVHTTASKCFANKDVTPQEWVNAAIEKGLNCVAVKGNFKLLGAVSPGQKTSAILSVILSQGDSPLILDQPEDDLDNKIIFDLIVQGVLEGKQRRQMIIVTHNANIPVNGDAEYIVSMNSESEKIAVLHCGTIEDEAVKKEICDVMEGSEEAFRRRAEKYGL